MGWASPGSRQVKILVPLAIFIVGLLAFVGTHTSGIAAHASAAEAAEVRAAERQARALSERTSFQDHERNRSLEQRSRRELLRAQIREALHRTETSTAALRAELNVSLTELNDALHERTRLMQRLHRAEQEALQYDQARRETLGDRHMNTLSSINNLGALLHAQGDLSGAEVLFREARDAGR